MVPRVVVFAGKAAPGYHAAKCIIHLINSYAHPLSLLAWPLVGTPMVPPVLPVLLTLAFFV